MRDLASISRSASPIDKQESDFSVVTVMGDVLCIHLDCLKMCGKNKHDDNLIYEDEEQIQNHRILPQTTCEQYNMKINMHKTEKMIISKSPGS